MILLPPPKWGVGCSTYRGHSALALLLTFGNIVLLYHLKYLQKKVSFHYSFCQKCSICAFT
jgi:hypothetical protein